MRASGIDGAESDADDPEDGAAPPHSLAQLSRWRHDPVAFAREVLGVDLWDRQRAIARALRSQGRVACRSCHAAGKTHLAATLGCGFWPPTTRRWC